MAHRKNSRHPHASTHVAAGIKSPTCVSVVCTVLQRKMPAIAFFPWLKIPEPLPLGRHRLVPYAVVAPLSADVHRIIRAYKQGRRTPVEHATLLEFNGVVEAEIDDDLLSEIFRLREALCFSALHRRRFFWHDGYLNAHSLLCIVQNFKPGQRGVGVTARRRHGHSMCFWFDEREVHCPAHVDAHTPLVIDEAVLATLARVCNGSGAEWLRDGMELFNLANTDSPDVRPHSELVLSVAAAQRLMGVERRADTRQIVSRFSDLLASAAPPARIASDGARTMDQTKPIREVWFEEFYSSRGVVAHGRPGGKPNPTWTIDEHLLLASFIIPRLALIRLNDEKEYELQDRDRDDIRAFDYLLCQPKLLQPISAPDENDVWAWNEALFASRNDRWMAEATAALAAAIDEDDPASEPRA